MADRVQQVAIPAPVAELVAAWNDRSAERFVAILAPDAHVVVPPLHLELQGRDDVWVGMARLFGAFGALRYTSRHRYLTPDAVTDEALLEGLQTAEFLGAPPPQRPGAVAARVIMRHDGAVITRLDVWPDVAALRDLFEGVARRIDLRTAGPAAPVVAALRATIPAPAGKLSLGQERQQPAGPGTEAALLAGSLGGGGGAGPTASGISGTGGGSPATSGKGGGHEEKSRGKGKATPKAPVPRKVRRMRAFLGGIVMLAVAGLLVAYVVSGVRSKTEPLAATKPRASASTATRPSVKPHPSPRPSTARPAVQFNKKTSSYTLEASLLFELNSAKLLPDARSVLDDVIGKIRQEKRFGLIQVRGYTDTTGTPALNLALSQQRAIAVARYLELNLPPNRFTVTPIGKGATNFVAPNDTEAERARNRRVEIKVPPQGQ